MLCTVSRIFAGNDKVQIAEECYSLVDRYLRKLDEELHKFKMELEADNRGITEILEKHSLEMDTVPQMANLKENRLPKKSKKSSIGNKRFKYYTKVMQFHQIFVTKIINKLSQQQLNLFL